MCVASFSQLAHDTITGRVWDQNQWFALDQVAPTGWEGDKGGPLAKRFDHGVLSILTWNAAKQLGGFIDSFANSESDKWFVWLDFLHSMRIDICALQEVGTGGSPGDEKRLRHIVLAWSRSRGVQARVWLAGAATHDGELDLRRRGGTPAGLATINFGTVESSGSRYAPLGGRSWAVGRIS